MKRVLFILAVLFALSAPLKLQAEEYDYLFDPFRAENYTTNELKFLQLGLAP